MAGLGSVIGNFTNTVDDFFSSVLNTASSELNNIVGSVGTGLSNIWSGGFVGMSRDGMNALKTSITKYTDSIQEIINKYNQDADVTSAVKGTKIEPAVSDFIAAIKELLQAYVSRILQEVAEAEEAYLNFEAAGQGIATQVSENATQVRQNAQKVKLD